MHPIRNGISCLPSFIALILLSVIVTACGGAGDSAEEGSASATNNTSTQTFPLNSSSDFQFHTTGSRFSIADNSAWLISGTVSGSNGNNTTNAGVRSLTIYENSSNFPDPDAGERAGYFMTVSGADSSFFVTPLSLNFVSNSSSDFRFHTSGSIFSISDNSAWLISGTITGNNGNSTTNAGVRYLYIYGDSNILPSPGIGEKAEYFMTVDGTDDTFFVKPLFLKVVTSGDVNFGVSSVGDIFSMLDESAWLIVGSRDGDGYTGSGDRSVIVYEATNDISQADRGVTSGYIMTVSSRETTFFIEPM